jgi:Domain of unknown function (DUF5655)/Domain of unknown function (DUF4287)
MAKMKKAPAALYSPHPSIEYARNVLAAMERKTGKNYEEWVAITKKSGLKTEQERRAWLKEKHGFGMNTAGWIAEMSVGKGQDAIDEAEYLKLAPGYVEAMYAAKTNLRPIHDALLELGQSMGSDVKVCPCQTMVPLYRNHVFAQIKPTTKTRIDLGFALGDTKATGRLIDTGGFAKKDRITHRIPIADLKEIDAEVKKWLKTAYDRDAGK